MNREAIMFFSILKNKKNKEMSAESNEATVEEDLDSTPYQFDVAFVDQETSVIYKPYLSLTTPDEQDQIIDFIRPVTARDQIINAQIAFGVRIDEDELLICRSRTEQLDNNAEKRYITYFVVKKGTNCFEIYYASNNSSDEGELSFSEGCTQSIRQACDYYRTWSNHREFEKQYAQKAPNNSLLKLNGDICKPLFKDYKEYEKKQTEIKKANRKNIVFTSEQQAKEFFVEHGFPREKDYTEETVSSFSEFATPEKRREWLLGKFAKEKDDSVQSLDSLLNGNRENITSKMKNISYELSGNEAHVPKYIRAVKLLLDEGEFDFFDTSVPKYLDSFIYSDNPFVVDELLNIAEEYYKAKYPNEYDSPEYDSKMDRFKKTCKHLRAQQHRCTPIENYHNFEFVFTSKETLKAIIQGYRKKYDNDDAVKECLGELNCAYGVSNEDIFVTALTDIADSTSLYSNRIEFTVLDKHRGIVSDINCDKFNEDGSLSPIVFNKELEDKYELIENAINYYLNEKERKKFFDVFEREYSESMKDYMKKCHKNLSGQFNRHYEEEYKRLGGHALEKELTNMLTLFEEAGPIEGYSKLQNGITDNDIQAWEVLNGVSLPVSYKQFLSFTNGLEVFGFHRNLYALCDIETNSDLINENYIKIGEYHDEAFVCMSKADGNIYIYDFDYGEYENKGDFKEFLSAWTSDIRSLMG